MMQVTVYNCRDFDEKDLFLEYAKELGIEVVLCADAPDHSNVSLCRGSRCVDVITSRIDAELMLAFHEQGVEYITTRTIGYRSGGGERMRHSGGKCSLRPAWGGRLYGDADLDVHP